jgi:hypothetical protein
MYFLVYLWNGLDQVSLDYLGRVSFLKETVCKLHISNFERLAFPYM